MLTINLQTLRDTRIPDDMSNSEMAKLAKQIMQAPIAAQQTSCTSEACSITWKPVR